jgi:hypothetical protein
MWRACARTARLWCRAHCHCAWFTARAVFMVSGRTAQGAGRACGPPTALRMTPRGWPSSAACPAHGAGSAPRSHAHLEVAQRRRHPGKRVRPLRHPAGAGAGGGVGGAQEGRSRSGHTVRPEASRKGTHLAPSPTAHQGYDGSSSMGNPSQRVIHGTRDAWKTCDCGCRGRGSWNSALATCSSPGQRPDLKNIGLPHLPQKPRSAPSGVVNQDSARRSLEISTAEASNPTHVTNAAPWARWHRVQWQWATHFGGNRAEHPTAPHRQLPLACCSFMLDLQPQMALRAAGRILVLQALNPLPGFR